jgi:hypothetical protein
MKSVHNSRLTAQVTPDREEAGNRAKRNARPHHCEEKRRKAIGVVVEDVERTKEAL